MNRISKRIFLLGLLLTVFLSGCQEKEAPETAPSDTPTPALAVETPSPLPTEEAVTPTLSPEVPLWSRIDGSTATIPLTAAMAAALEGIPVEEAQALIHHNTTDHAYMNLIDGTADLIFVTSPSSYELEWAQENEVTLEVIPVVKDAFVFLVNAQNPVSGLTLEEFKAIYTREITNWSQVGGLDEDIIPYQRPDNSGSQTLFYKLVMTDVPPVRPPSEWVQGDMGGLVKAIADYDNSRAALGYSVYYYVNNMYSQNEQFKLLSVDGVYPTAETILSGAYPLSDAYYAVLRADTPSDAPVRALVDWLLSADGQEVAVNAGYVGDAETPYPYAVTHLSSGTGGPEGEAPAAPRPDPDDITRLSDLFYDGVNYIDYINRAIAVQALSGNAYDNYEEGILTRGLSRPFSGIPHDYQSFRVWGDDLYIIFPEGNPYFADERWVPVPLLRQLSPYGKTLPEREPEKQYKFTYVEVDFVDTENYADVKPIVLQASDWGTEEQINALIDAWYLEHLQEPSDYGPSIDRWGDYLFGSFSFGDIRAETSQYKHFCIDMRQGTFFEPEELALSLIPFDSWWKLEGNHYSKGDGWGGSVSLPEGYAPSEATIYSDYSFMFESVTMHVSDPLVGEFKVWFNLDDLVALAGWPPQDYETLVTFNLN